MAVKTRTLSERTEAAPTVFKRLGGIQRVNSNVICKYWLLGRCNRNPCKFLHKKLPTPQPNKSCKAYGDDNSNDLRSKLTWRNPNYDSSKSVSVSVNGKFGSVSVDRKAGPVSVSGKSGLVPVSGKSGSESNPAQKTQEDDQSKGAQGTQLKISNSEGSGCGGKIARQIQLNVCKFWVSGNCVQGDKCKDLHSWFCGDGFSMVAKLEGHNETITGIALPSGSDKLYSGSKDKCLRVWDCNSGQCTGGINLQGECGTLISEGPWLFVGSPNTMKAWNLQTQTELTLSGLTGQVCSMVVGDDMLFAGTEDGTILAWKLSSETNYWELAASLKGHESAVLSLAVGYEALYSGCMDGTIKLWNQRTLKCIQILCGHTSAVTSVLCWDRFLLSGSLDNTIKVWAANKEKKIELYYEQEVEHGVLAFCGVTDAEAKPILFCSSNDNTVRLYELPSFNLRGKIFAKSEVRTVQIGTGGLFFTGDGTGQLTVWKLHEEPTAAS